MVWRAFSDSSHLVGVYSDEHISANDEQECANCGIARDVAKDQIEEQL